MNLIKREHLFLASSCLPIFVYAYKDCSNCHWDNPDCNYLHPFKSYIVNGYDMAEALIEGEKLKEKYRLVETSEKRLHKQHHELLIWEHENK